MKKSIKAKLAKGICDACYLIELSRELKMPTVEADLDKIYEALKQRWIDEGIKLPIFLV